MSAEEIITKVKDLPVVSETARKLTIQLNQPDLHRDELVRTLRCDNVLTAKLLKVCNSAECGARGPVDSLDQALLILGDNAIFRMVCAIGYGTSLGLAAPGYDTEANGLWFHSLDTAMAAEHLSKIESCGDFLPATAFTAGLLHDIGKVVLHKFMTPKHRADIRAKMSSPAVNRCDAEKAVFGADHSEIGACLLRHWSLPEPILEAVRNHHKPVVQPQVQLSAVVYLANCAAHLGINATSAEPHVAAIKTAAAQTLGMEIAELEKAFAGLGASSQTLPPFQVAA